MLLRYGLAHAFVILASLAAMVAILVPLLWLVSLVSKDLAESPLAEKVTSGLGVLFLVGLPFGLFLFGTTVWVVEEGEQGQLTSRRYLLYGQESSVARTNGPSIPFRVGLRGDVVVNAADATIQVEEVAYGVGASQYQLKRLLIEPGEALTVPIVEAVGSPPNSVELRGRVRSTVKAYIHR
jgi:hypothetical protein